MAKQSTYNGGKSQKRIYMCEYCGTGPMTPGKLREHQADSCVQRVVALLSEGRIVRG